MTLPRRCSHSRSYVFLARGVVRPGIPIPLSFFVSAALAVILVAAWGRPLPMRKTGGLYQIVALALACLVCFSVAQMFLFGMTDYRRPADVAVVLGARVYADGRLSDALADRVRTACQLYRDGQVRHLVFSGGPGDGAIHETEAIKRMATSLGAKAEDIWLDRAGVNTQATVKNTQVFSRSGTPHASWSSAMPTIYLASSWPTRATAGMCSRCPPRRATYCARCLTIWRAKLPQYGSTTCARW